MWERLNRVAIVVTILTGVIAIGGAIALPEIPKWISARLSDLYNIAALPVQIPLIILLILALWFIFGIIQRLQKKLRKSELPSQPQEPTHEAEFKGMLIRYYIDPKTNLPKVVPPLVCSECRGTIDKLQQYSFDPSSVIVVCSNGHSFEKLILNNGLSPENSLKYYLLNVQHDFVHQFREQELASKLNRVN